MTGVVTNFVTNTLAQAAQVNAAFLQCFPASAVSAFSETVLSKTTGATWRAAAGAIGAPVAANDNEVAIYDGSGALLKSSGTLWSSVARINANQSWTGNQNFTGAVVTVADQAVGAGSSAVANTKYINDFFTAIFPSIIAPTNSPVFTGSPQAPTAATSSSNTLIATTAFVKSVLGNYAGVLAVTANTTLTSSAFGNAIQSLAASTINITLPTSNPWSGASGPTLHVFNHGTAACSIIRQGTDFIYCPPAGLTSATSITLQPGQDVILLNRGTTEWDIVGGTWLVANTANVPNTSVTGLGTASTKNVGTAANNVVQLNGSAQLPALDGSLLTGVASTWAPGSLYGLTLSRSGVATIGIAAGSCRNEDGGTAFNMTLASAITKTLSAWAAGSGNGGLDTGSIAGSTWYHVHLIRKTSDGSIDALLSLSATAPTMPSGYVARRRLGSILTDGSSQVVLFYQSGDEFYWDSPVIDVDATNPGTSAVTRSLTVPVGLTVFASINVGLYYGNSASVHSVTSLDTSDPTIQTSGTAALTGIGDVGPSAAGAPVWAFNSKYVKTNTSGQVRSKLSGGGSSTHVGIITTGWRDSRGK